MLVWFFTSRYFYSEGRLIVFQRAWKVFRKFCPLCYKQVVAEFCENFENTRENLSSILLGLMRLHIQIVLHSVQLPTNHGW